MRPRLPAWCGVSVAFALAAGTAGAADRPAPPVREAVPVPGREGPAEASIELAKRDFDSVKAMRDLKGAPQGGTVRLEALEVAGSAVAGAVAPAAKPRLPERPGQGTNWLIDAMQETGSRGAPREEVAGAAAGRPAGRSGRAGTSERPDPQGGEGEPGRPAPPNPFLQYLGQWMSPQDYLLLKPALEPAKALDLPRVNASGERPGAIPTGTLEVPTISTMVETRPRGTLAGSAAQPGLRPEVGPNPYLEALGAQLAPPPAPVPARPVRPPAPVSAVNPAPAATEATSAGRSRTPEFVRPNNDERYFKQLKRF